MCDMWSMWCLCVCVQNLTEADFMHLKAILGFKMKSRFVRLVSLGGGLSFLKKEKESQYSSPRSQPLAERNCSDNLVSLSKAVRFPLLCLGKQFHKELFLHARKCFLTFRSKVFSFVVFTFSQLYFQNSQKKLFYLSG